MVFLLFIFGTGLLFCYLSIGSWIFRNDHQFKMPVRFSGEHFKILWNHFLENPGHSLGKLVFLFIGIAILFTAASALFNKVVFNLIQNTLQVKSGPLPFWKYKRILLNQINEIQVRHRQVLEKRNREPVITYEVVASLNDQTDIVIDEGLVSEKWASDLANWISENAGIHRLKAGKELVPLPDLKRAGVEALRNPNGSGSWQISKVRIRTFLGGVIAAGWCLFLIVLLNRSSFDSSFLLVPNLFLTLCGLYSSRIARNSFNELVVSVVGDELIIKRGLKTISLPLSKVVEIRANAGSLMREDHKQRYQYAFEIEFSEPTVFGTKIEFMPSEEYRKNWTVSRNLALQKAGARQKN
jgi:hypothetical protein